METGSRAGPRGAASGPDHQCPERRRVVRHHRERGTGRRRFAAPPRPGVYRQIISNERVGTRTSSGERSRTTSSATRGTLWVHWHDDSNLTHIEERKHEAMAMVRLVRKDGDVRVHHPESRNRRQRRCGRKIARQLAADLERPEGVPPTVRRARVSEGMRPLITSTWDEGIPISRARNVHSHQRLRPAAATHLQGAVRQLPAISVFDSSRPP
jgi:hypothetical protein